MQICCIDGQCIEKMLKNLKANYGIHIAVVDMIVLGEVTSKNDVVESLWMTECSLFTV